MSELDRLGTVSKKKREEYEAAGLAVETLQEQIGQGKADYQALVKDLWSTQKMDRSDVKAQMSKLGQTIKAQINELGEAERRRVLIFLGLAKKAAEKLQADWVPLKAAYQVIDEEKKDVRRGINNLVRVRGLEARERREELFLQRATLRGKAKVAGMRLGDANRRRNTLRSYVRREYGVNPLDPDGFPMAAHKAGASLSEGAAAQVFGVFDSVCKAPRGEFGGLRRGKGGLHRGG